MSCAGEGVRDEPMRGGGLEHGVLGYGRVSGLGNGGGHL